MARLINVFIQDGKLCLHMADYVMKTKIPSGASPTDTARWLRLMAIRLEKHEDELTLQQITAIEPEPEDDE